MTHPPTVTGGSPLARLPRRPHDDVADLDSALSWTRSVWEERPIPRRLHERGLVADQDQMGGPEMTRAFLRRLMSGPDDREVEFIRQDCADVSPACRLCKGSGRLALRVTTWRSPLRHALRQVRDGDHRTWAPFVARRSWHPTPYQVIADLAAAGLHRPVTLHYTTGDIVPDDFAEVFALSALRKLYAAYESGWERTVPWDQLSESQRNALDAA